MSSYIRSLVEKTERNRALQEQEFAAKKAEQQQLLSPLEERVARLLDTIPVQRQAAGLSLSELTDRLRGRQGGSCHAGELGAALRKLGFQRRRQWRRDAGFGALWFPSPITRSCAGKT